MIKAVFFDFYNTLCVWDNRLKSDSKKLPLGIRLSSIGNGIQRCARNLYAEASAADPSDYDILQVMRKIVDSYYEFIKALGAEEHAEQMTWELLQSEHSLFYATSATLYDDGFTDACVFARRGFQVSDCFKLGHTLRTAYGATRHCPLLRCHCRLPRFADSVVKPDPYIFNYTLSAVGVSAEETVYVGDTYETDIVGASRCRDSSDPR